jgi:hypothetical protein
MTLKELAGNITAVKTVWLGKVSNLSQFAKIFEIQSKFDWRTYIDGTFKNVKNLTITDDEMVLVDDWTYLQNATELYAKYASTQKKFAT